MKQANKSRMPAKSHNADASAKAKKPDRMPPQSTPNHPASQTKKTCQTTLLDCFTIVSAAAII
ncbi:hypothetical protein, partial [Burkholderia sp. SIMBA_051]|uniref:hypothetical protein n=1 Tax=Burkholderia sp. SIMBA_051 TaxID=3085792 RepID=UPI0039786E78